MTLTKEYKDAFSEVFAILNVLKKEDYNKIPKDIVDVIKENKNDEYSYQVDEDKDLSDQNILPETQAILFNLYRDYIASNEKKEEILKRQNKKMYAQELEKQKKYGTDVIFKNDISNENVTMELLDTSKEKNEGIFKRLIQKIKNIFHK